MENRNIKTTKTSLKRNWFLFLFHSAYLHLVLSHSLYHSACFASVSICSNEYTTLTEYFVQLSLFIIKMCVLYIHAVHWCECFEFVHTFSFKKKRCRILTNSSKNGLQDKKKVSHCVFQLGTSLQGIDHHIFCYSHLYLNFCFLAFFVSLFSNCLPPPKETKQKIQNIFFRLKFKY